MSLTKYILKEFVSDAKREYLREVVSLGILGFKKPLSPEEQDFIDFLDFIDETKKVRGKIDMEGMDKFYNDWYESVDTHIDRIDNTPNKRYVEWFYFKQKNYTAYVMDNSMTNMMEDFVQRRYDQMKNELNNGYEASGNYTFEKVKELKNSDQQLYRIIMQYLVRFKRVLNNLQNGKLNFDNGKYIQKNYVLEDAPEINETFDLHFKVKQRKDFPQQYKDINNISNYAELVRILEPYRDRNIKSFEDVIKVISEGTDYQVVYKDSTVEVYKPLTEKGACVLGYKTNWCTTWGEHSMNIKYKNRRNYFETYSDETNFITPPIYIFRWLNVEDGDPEQFVQMYIGADEKQQVKDVRDLDVETLVRSYMKKLSKKLVLIIADDYLKNLVSELGQDDGQIMNVVSMTDYSYEKLFDKKIDKKTYEKLVLKYVKNKKLYFEAKKEYEDSDWSPYES